MDVGLNLAGEHDSEGTAEGQGDCQDATLRLPLSQARDNSARRLWRLTGVPPVATCGPGQQDPDQ